MGSLCIARSFWGSQCYLSQDASASDVSFKFQLRGSHGGLPSQETDELMYSLIINPLSVHQQVQLPNVPQYICQLYVHPHFLSVHPAGFLLWMVSELDPSSTHYNY